MARAVAGCPVYASDASESFRMDILRPLLLPESDEVPCLSSSEILSYSVFPGLALEFVVFSGLD